VHVVRDLRAAVRAFAPFGMAAVLAWTVALIGSHVEWGQYALSGLLAVVAGSLAVWATRDRAGAGAGLVPAALLFLAGVAFLRNSVGGSSSGTSALAMIPVFHTALYSRARRDLGVVVAGVGLFYLLPILIVGPPAYPHSQYRSAVLTVAVSAIIGFATQQLVASVRRQVTQARQRERMLEQLGDVVHHLFDSPHPRIDVCQAAKSISTATIALLYEPSADGDGLVCTAVTQREGEALRKRAGDGSAVQEAFDTRRPVLVTTDVEAHVGNRASWIATGRPRSVLYQPLIRHGVAQGVLVVGWADEIQAGGTHTTIASLLAHEAAAVIARADVLDNLADEAQTDPLTGLPNRRAWDAQVKRLHSEGGLLRECDSETALEVTERLRGSVSDNWTCSAGIAAGRPGESAEDTIARADVALYEAKAAGRDRTHLAGVA
jgi:hypothetical protein